MLSAASASASVLARLHLDNCGGARAGLPVTVPQEEGLGKP
ncbi:hypothetical protein [Streptomyces lunaelactis]|nr:hypothetical protein [Streptomyces lunaelactis]